MELRGSEAKFRLDLGAPGRYGLPPRPLAAILLVRNRRRVLSTAPGRNAESTSRPDVRQRSAVVERGGQNGSDGVTDTGWWSNRGKRRDHLSIPNLITLGGLIIRSSSGVVSGQTRGAFLLFVLAGNFRCCRRLARQALEHADGTRRLSDPMADKLLIVSD